METMKNMLMSFLGGRSCSLFFLFLLVMTIITSSLNASSSMSKSVLYLQNSFHCEYSTAKKLQHKIQCFVDGLQINISYLASSEDSYRIKRKRKNRFVDKYFESKNSTVQVSSKHRRRLREYEVSRYLDRLIRLKKIYGYTKVELIFVPEYLGIGKFHRISDHVYEVAISMKQIFMGYYGERVVYSDITRKKFRLNFHLGSSSNDEVVIKTNEIYVNETEEYDPCN